jgi:2-polyprenyl-3-methyl-5-hydroxy-6-metoxy-1,4-benzoquinol methylase
MANKTNKVALDDTGERMIPSYHKGTVMYAEHMSRYVAAKDIIKGKVVLDIASGSGYGTKILAEHAEFVYGVDVDEPAVEYAKNNFSAPNITYKVGDGEKIPLDNASVDVVITFETIEHVKDYKKFVKEIRRVLKPDGIAIVSTPNELEFTDGNHYHLHEFEYDELRSLLASDFKYIDPYFQATWVSVAITNEENISKESTFEPLVFNYKPLEREKYLYFYLVCSNKKIEEKVPSVLALGGHYSARELTEISDLNSNNLANYKIVVDNANKEIERLNDLYTKTNNELQQAKDEINAILNSKTFKIKSKITKPFTPRHEKK